MLRCSLIALALFSVTVTAQAQTVDEIVAKHIIAMGGAANIQSVQSLRITSTIQYGELHCTITQDFKRPSKMRSKMTCGATQYQQSEQGYDGQDAWEIPVGGKNAQSLVGDEFDKLKTQTDINSFFTADDPLVDYRAKGNTVELVGKELIDNTGAYHLKVTLKNHLAYDLYLDEHTFLTLKGEFTEKKQRIVCTFGKYKQVEGVMLPFLISFKGQAASDHKPAVFLTFEVLAVEANVPLADSVFSMPAPASEAPTKP